MYRIYIKRILDFIIASIALIVLLPVLLILTLLLFFANSGKPFFYQERPGMNGKIFTLIKFKTMTDRKDENGMLLPDEFRLTNIGKFVRRSSLDELPQLFNVILGHMSLIGPRPLLVEYLPLYTAFQAERHHVRPGITGWAQVNGRNAISWSQKFKLDVWYVKNLSFYLDMKIVYITIKKIWLREGISSSTSVTMEKFKGEH